VGVALAFFTNGPPDDAPPFDTLASRFWRFLIYI